MKQMIFNLSMYMMNKGIPNNIPAGSKWRSSFWWKCPVELKEAFSKNKMRSKEDVVKFHVDKEFLLLKWVLFHLI